MDEEDFQESMYNNNDNEDVNLDDAIEIKNKAMELKSKISDYKSSSTESARAIKDGSGQVSKAATTAGKNVATAGETAANAGKGAVTAGKTAGNAGKGAVTAGKAAATAGKGAATAGKAAATAGSVAAGGAISATGIGAIIVAGIGLLKALSKAAKKKKEKRKNESTDIKVQREVIKLAPLLFIIGGGTLVFSFVSFFSVGPTVTTYDSLERLDQFIECAESNGVCTEITDLELEEPFKGYNKPLMLFTYQELQNTVDSYVKFSNKYFDTGEGIFFDDTDELKEEFDMDESEELAKEEIDSAVLASFLSLEARAFSRIKWREAYYDENDVLVEKDITEFDVFYDTNNDITANLSKWFSWFGTSSAGYSIKIPSVEKYSMKTQNGDYDMKMKITTTTNGETSTSDYEQSGVYPEIKEPVEGSITEEYKLSVLKNYIQRLYPFLPQWFEPYSIYLATGDTKYARDFYLKYLDLLRNDPDMSITVTIYKCESDVETVEVTNSDITTTENGKDDKGNSYTKITNTVTEKTSKSHIINEFYNSIIISGPKYNELYKQNVLYALEKNITEKEEPKHRVINQENTSGTTKTSTSGTETIETTRNIKRRIQPKLPDGANTISYYELIGDKDYEKNQYINYRISYLHKLICDELEIAFTLDDIAPAIECIVDYYKKYDMKISGVINSVPNVNDQTYNEGVTPGKIDVDKGWDNTFTSSSGKTYREYKQNLGYYKDKQYGPWGPFSSYACPMVATSIFLEGYGIYVDPYKLYQKVGALNPANATNVYTGTNVAVSEPYNKQKLISELSKGKPVAIHNNSWNSDGHYMTLLDYDPITDRGYLSVVHTGFKGKTDGGWIGLDLIGIDTIYYIPDGNM